MASKNVESFRLKKECSPGDVSRETGLTILPFQMAEDSGWSVHIPLSEITDETMDRLLPFLSLAREGTDIPHA